MKVISLIFLFMVAFAAFAFAEEQNFEEQAVEFDFKGEPDQGDYVEIVAADDQPQFEEIGRVAEEVLAAVPEPEDFVPEVLVSEPEPEPIKAVEDFAFSPTTTESVTTKSSESQVANSFAAILNAPLVFIKFLLSLPFRLVNAITSLFR
jgi:hypothetical protein